MVGVLELSYIPVSLEARERRFRENSFQIWVPKHQHFSKHQIVYKCLNFSKFCVPKQQWGGQNKQTFSMGVKCTVIYLYYFSCDVLTTDAYYEKVVSEFNFDHQKVVL